MGSNLINVLIFSALNETAPSSLFSISLVLIHFQGSEKTRNSKIGKQFSFARNPVLNLFSVGFPNSGKYPEFSRKMS